MTNNVPEWARAVAHTILLSVKAKDPFTYYHCCRVGLEARKLGRFIGLDQFQQNILEYSGMFHDIGKVSIADNILLKPDKLTNEEYKVMKSHAEVSAAMIRPLAEQDRFFKLLIPGIRYHHERIDGKGYPNKLSGERIPITARILSIVDTVDAMTNTRPYRKALTMDIAKKELLKYSNQQFDASLVQSYLKSLETKGSNNDELISVELLKVA